MLTRSRLVAVLLLISILPLVVIPIYMGYVRNIEDLLTKFIAGLAVAIVCAAVGLFFRRGTSQTISEESQMTVDKQSTPSEYSSEEFVETRPILPDLSRIPKDKSQDIGVEYRKARVAYEQELMKRYYAENLVTWEGRSHPTSVLFSCNLGESQVTEEFDLDEKGKVREYVLPAAIHEWGYDRLLAFMKENPLVRRGTPLYDGPLAHPVRYDLSDNQFTLWFQKSSFFKYVVTNLAIDIRSKHKMKSLREILEPGIEGKLCSLESSQMGGSLGIGCIVRSKDRKFVVVWRSDQVSNAKLMFAPSASGTMRFDDVRKSEENAPPSIFESARRQLKQEMAVERTNIRKMVFIGLTRELERGGQIEAHFYVEVNLSFDELNKIRNEAEHVEEHTYYVPVDSVVAIASYIGEENSSPALKGGVFLLHNVLLTKSGTGKFQPS